MTAKWPRIDYEKLANDRLDEPSSDSRARVNITIIFEAARNVPADIQQQDPDVTHLAEAIQVRRRQRG